MCIICYRIVSRALPAWRCLSSNSSSHQGSNGSSRSSGHPQTTGRYGSRPRISTTGQQYFPLTASLPTSFSPFPPLPTSLDPLPTNRKSFMAVRPPPSQSNPRFPVNLCNSVSSSLGLLFLSLSLSQPDSYIHYLGSTVVTHSHTLTYIISLTPTRLSFGRWTNLTIKF